MALEDDVDDSGNGHLGTRRGCVWFVHIYPKHKARVAMCCAFLHLRGALLAATPAALSNVSALCWSVRPRSARPVPNRFMAPNVALLTHSNSSHW